MKIIVESENLVQVANAIKRLPVQGDFNTADLWVGTVMVIQKIIEEAKEYIPPEISNGAESCPNIEEK